ncbi:benzyl alcohol O-benzoyltransferase-like [Carex rostrata]
MTSILCPSISFNVKRSKPEVIAPAKPTPHEVKSLSDIDDQAGLQFYSPGVHFYHSNPSKVAHDPANVIKAALAEALVYYYPIAGRLREQPDGKLVVDCTGEGAMFVEADADVELEYLGDPITPPIPFIDRLLFDSELMGLGVVDQPLLYIQVTRFKCGGFTFGVKTCHIIADGFGVAQFQTAISELARGAKQPSVLPVWDRHLLLARDPPVPTHIHREYEPIEDATQEEYDMVLKTPPANLVDRSFFFGPNQISALRRHVQSLKPMSHVSRFELITAAVWRSRTISLDYNPDSEVRVQFPVNLRGKMVPPLPTGFYGNAFARAMAFSKAGKLCSSPLEYALKLIQEAKAKATSTDFLQSLADMLVQRKRPRFLVARTFMVSDLTRAGFQTVDFGWGGGMHGTKPFPWVVTFYTSFKNSVDEEVVVVPMCLPEAAMETFKEEMESLIQT